MLILSRKKDDTILIGDDIRILVVAVRGNTVRLGIDAPRHIRITRTELLESTCADDGTLEPGRDSHSEGTESSGVRLQGPSSFPV